MRFKKYPQMHDTGQGTLFFCVSLLTYPMYAPLRYSKNNVSSLVLEHLKTLSTLLLSLSLAILLSACASTTAYQQQINQWHGKKIQQLKNSWGKPDTTVKLADGHTLYHYTRKNFYTIRDPKRQPLQLNNASFTSYGQPWLNNQTMVRYCRTTFETNTHGDIIHTRFSGNNCIAYRFSR